jgi:hypothetical protein
MTGVGKGEGVEVGGNHTFVGVGVSVGKIVAVGRGGKGVFAGKQAAKPHKKNRVISTQMTCIKLIFTDLLIFVRLLN